MLRQLGTLKYGGTSAAVKREGCTGKECRPSTRVVWDLLVREIGGTIHCRSTMDI